MTLTNPGAITNSGSKAFTNQFATVAKINYNRNLNNEEYQAYQNYTWYATHGRKHEQYCKECDSSTEKKEHKKVKKEHKKEEKEHKKEEKKVHKKEEKKVKKEHKKEENKKFFIIIL